jgi:hypothetical protein
MYLYNQHYAKEVNRKKNGEAGETTEEEESTKNRSQKSELLSTSKSVSKIKARYLAIGKIRRNAIQRLIGGRTKNPINILIKRYPAERRFLETQGGAKNNIKPTIGAEKSRMVNIDTMLYNAIRSGKKIIKETPKA